MQVGIAEQHDVAMISRTGKSQYTESEAAEELGVSVDRLRVLIRQHIVTSDEDLNNVPMATFQPSDLLLLKLLTSSPEHQPEPQETPAQC
jgi:hypothetical protein